MTHTDWQQSVLDEIHEDQLRSARFLLVSFISKSRGSNRRSSPRNVQLVKDVQLGICHLLNEDWFNKADEVEYHLTGDDLINTLLRYGFA